MAGGYIRGAKNRVTRGRNMYVDIYIYIYIFLEGGGGDLKNEFVI